MAEHTSSPTLGGTPGTDYGTSRTSSSGSGTGTGIVDKVKEQATAQLSSQKDKATQGLGSVASAVRQTTQSLRDQQHETVAGYVEQAADQIERLSERLKNKDVTELLNDAQQLARRQPAIFIGGAFALGLVGARFLKSSSKDDYDDYRSGGTYGSYGSTSGAYGTGAYGTGTNRTNIGTGGSTGDITGGRSTTDLGTTGAAGYSGSSYGTSGERQILDPIHVNVFDHGIRRIHGPPRRHREVLMADRPTDDRSIGDLLAELSRETSELVKKEVELATTEMTAKARRAGGHVGVAAAGGALAHAGLLVFLAALVLGLSQLGVTPWLSALIISLLTIGIGYMLVNRGLTGLRSTNVAPTRAMESLKEDSRWTTRQGA